MINKLEGKTAVITGGTEGIGLATAKLFVKEGAYVFITGRRQKELDEAVTAIGRNVTGVQGDVAQLADTWIVSTSYIDVEQPVKMLFGDFAEGNKFTDARIGENNIDSALYLTDCKGHTVHGAKGFTAPE